MLEYVFFNQPVADRFARYLTEMGIDSRQEKEPVHDGVVVKFSEDALSEEQWDAIDEHYDTLLDEDRVEFEKQADEQSVRKAGIYIALEDGCQTLAMVDPDVMNRMLTVVSMDELNAFVHEVARSVENPDDTPICVAGHAE